MSVGSCHAGLDPASSDGVPMTRGTGLRVKSAMTALGALFAATTALAQSTPIGLWRTIDDKSGEPRAEIRIIETAGVVNGRIERRLGKSAKPGEVCEPCRDERRNKPIEGLEIIRNAHRAEGGEVWEGGKVLDPENGREYTLRLTPVEGGRQLEVRGSIGPFGRTQTWVRVQ